MEIIGKTIHFIPIEARDNPEQLWDIVCDLSDGTSATPMGGGGFAKIEDAADAMERIEFDGEGRLVIGDGRCGNCGKTHAPSHQPTGCVIDALLGVLRDRYAGFEDSNAERVNSQYVAGQVEASAFWDHFGGPAVDYIAKQIGVPPYPDLDN